MVHEIIIPLTDELIIISSLSPAVHSGKKYGTESKDDRNS